jgi:hypothetical protein
MRDTILKYLPSTPAAKLEAVLALVNGEPIYCDCMPECPKIVGRTPPLITHEEAQRFLDTTKDQTK